MQPNTISECAYRPFVCGAGVTGAIVITPATANAMSFDEVVQGISSSPWACFGLGVAAGTLVTAVIARGVCRRRLNEFKEQLLEQEDMLEMPVGAQVAQNTPGQSIPFQQVLVADKPFVVPEDPAPSESNSAAAPHVSQGVSTETPAISDTAARKRVLEVRVPEIFDSPLGDILKVSDENDLPRIDRGQSSLGLYKSNNDLDRTHAMEVLRTLDGATRARMISKRVPSLGFLNAHPEPGNTGAVASIRPKQKATDPVNRVSQIFEEELERSQQYDAREFSRARLTIVEGPGKHMASGPKKVESERVRPQRGKHFAHAVQEA